MEKWKNIQGFPNYQISDSGRVKNILNGRVKKHHIGRHGYKAISLWNTGKPKTFLVHRLVAKYFVANPLKKKQVNHKDGDKMNNAASNLEWVTASENTVHSYKNGLQLPQLGESHGRSKLTESDVLSIREMISKGVFQKDIAAKFGVDKSTISYIKNGKIWGHV